MQNIFEDYIQSISSKFSHTETSEIGYRTDFEILLRGVFESIKVSRFDNDPKAKEGNKPDFVVIKDDVPLLYIETKNIGTSLDKVEKSEQMGRYFGYANLVLTDYLEFRFYRNGLPYGEPIRIGSYDIKSRSIYPILDNYELLAKTLLEFTQSYKEPIRSGKHLAKIMAGKARRIRNNIRQFLTAELDDKTDLVKLYFSIKKYLVHDLTVDTFADMYAQTLVYGLFIARFNDSKSNDFTRSKARDLIPNSNPFLKSFFDHIVGIDFDSRLKFIVDELCEVYSHSDIEKLLRQFSDEDLWGKTHKKPDPVIYFYEDFLKEYDPNLRKKMGAYYTPEPVVQFIVRAVDDILKKDFKLPKGFGDTSKTLDGLHKVQILDPATGTGTFISAVIRSIYKPFKTNKQEAAWPGYVHYNLLPRIYGFEIMMTPYTIAHLKLSLALKETGFHTFYETSKGKTRLGIYLTNALEGEETQPDLFSGVGLSESIVEESRDASKIKNKKPIMVVIGNPPYSVSSSNKGGWIQNLIKDYKIGLNEKKINLDDDYIKFIRFAEHFVEKNGSGVVAMITNNSFIDGATHRQMRKHLLETFDGVFILNLHGSTKKKEEAPDGSKDENIFNIEQGVSINIFIRKGNKKTGLGIVHYSEIYGIRESKFSKLNESDLQNIKWKVLNYSQPNYFFVPKDFRAAKDYDDGFKIDDLFPIYSSGIETQKDSLVIRFSQKDLDNVRFDMENGDSSQIFTKYKIKDSRDWNFQNAKTDLEKAIDSQVLYRPFDKRWTFYSGKTKGILAYPRDEVMHHLNKQNIALLIAKRVTSFSDWHHVFISENITERCSVSLQTGEVGYTFPLYLYSNDGSKMPNLKSDIVDRIKKVVGEVSSVNIFDYIYATLNSLRYRKKYREFLKIDFPRIPYPKDKTTFEQLARFGRELRELHLMESSKLDNLITSFNIVSDNVVGIIKYKGGNVYINENQYFGNVLEIAWNFYIGGYQPAQKWLKDRKGRELTSDDIEHYQKIIVALVETAKVQKLIDKILVV